MTDKRNLIGFCGLYCGDCAGCEKLKFLETNHGVAHLKNLRKLKKHGSAAFVKGKRYWYAPK